MFAFSKLNTKDYKLFSENMVKVIIADNGTAIGREESKTLFEPTEKSNCK